MGFFRCVVLVAFLAYIRYSSTTTASKMTPSSDQRYTKTYPEFEHKRMLRSDESNEHEKEERAVTDFFTSTTIKFKVGRLGSTVDAALQNPKLDKIWNYVDTYNKGKIASKQVSVTGNLMKKYGETNVLTAIAKAKKSTSSNAVATRLETDLLLNYASIFKGKKDLTEVKKIITNFFGGKRNTLSKIGKIKKQSQVINNAKELNDLETAILVQYLERELIQRNIRVSSYMIDGQHLDGLEKFFGQLSKQFPSNDISFLRILIGKYGDGNVAKGLVEAQAVPLSKDIATRLQTQQFKIWLDDGKSIDDVFKLLKMDKYNEFQIVTSPGLDALDIYTKLFNSAKRTQESFIGKIATRFKGEDKLAFYLAEASLLHVEGPFAIKLETKMFQQWFDDGVDSVEKVYIKLKVPETGASNIQKRSINHFKKFLENKLKVSNAANVANPA